MRIAIVGGGVLVYFVSRALITKGHRILIINRAREECTQLARRLNATVVAGDATSPAVLEDADVRSHDAVMAMTSHDEDNLLICQLAGRYFNVPRAFALVNDPLNEPLFRLLGITETFAVTTIFTSLIEQRASFDSIINVFPAVDLSVHVAEVLLPNGAPSTGAPLSTLKLPPGTLIATVAREGREIVPDGRTILEAGDRVLVITRADALPRVMERLTGSIK